MQLYRHPGPSVVNQSLLLISHYFPLHIQLCRNKLHSQISCCGLNLIRNKSVLPLIVFVLSVIRKLEKKIILMLLWLTPTIQNKMQEYLSGGDFFFPQRLQILPNSTTLICGSKWSQSHMDFFRNTSQVAQLLKRSVTFQSLLIPCQRYQIFWHPL